MTPIAAVVLAAGQGSRYRASGGLEPTKLVAKLQGEPLVRRVVLAAIASKAAPVLVVSGHARGAVEAALADLPVCLVHNDHFASGLASSVRTGVAAVPAECSGAVVLLADMPAVSSTLIDRMLVEARSGLDWDAIVPVTRGRRGNPVVLSRSLFPAVAALSGDAGARFLLQQEGVRVRDVPVDTSEVALDVDILRDLERL